MVQPNQTPSSRTHPSPRAESHTNFLGASDGRVRVKEVLQTKNDRCGKQSREEKEMIIVRIIRVAVVVIAYLTRG